MAVVSTMFVAYAVITVALFIISWDTPKRNCGSDRGALFNTEKLH